MLDYNKRCASLYIHEALLKNILREYNITDNIEDTVYKGGQLNHNINNVINQIDFVRENNSYLPISVYNSQLMALEGLLLEFNDLNDRCLLFINSLNKLILDKYKEQYNEDDDFEYFVSILNVRNEDGSFVFNNDYDKLYERYLTILNDIKKDGHDEFKVKKKRL